jgi:hypothetical protein
VPSIQQRRVSMEPFMYTPSLRYAEQLPYFFHKASKNRTPPCGTRKAMEFNFYIIEDPKIFSMTGTE